MTVDEYAKRYNRLHPTIIRVLQPYFKISLKTVEVKRIEYSPTTTIWTLGDVVVVLEDKLNAHFTQESFQKDGKLWHRSNGAIDLATDHGIQTLAHELKHCEQWRLIPRWKFLLWYLPGVLRGWIAGRRYAHKFIRWETEAIAFQKTVQITAKERQSFLLLQ